MLTLYGAAMLVGWPLITWYGAIVRVLENGQPLSQAWHSLLRQDRINWWIDLMVLSGGFAVQLAWTVWQRSRQREQALLRAESDNYRLRLSLLQGQLEPHFLFNTLNSVSALVRAGERGTALSSLAKVSELLRHALRASQSPWLSLREELSFVTDYLALQHLRFGEGMKADLQIAPAPWEQLACPPLLFQPLVENAIRHGLEAREGQGELRLQLALRGERVHFRLENALPEPGLGLAGHGVGLSATRERLALLFGEQASLQTRHEGGLFVLELEFPAKDLDDALDRPDR